MSRKKLKVSVHARERAKERLDLSFHSEVNKRFNDALKYGNPTDKFKGDFYTYLVWKRKHQKRPGTSLKVFMDNIVVYRNQTIITTYKVPAKFLPTSDFLKYRYIVLNDLGSSNLFKKYKLSGEGVEIEIFPPSDEGDFVAGLYVNDIFEGFGSGKTRYDAVECVLMSYLNKKEVKK